MKFQRALIALAFAAAAAHALAGEERFTYTPDAALAFNFPDEWKHERLAGSTTIVLTPRAGKGFRVQLTPLVGADGSLPRTDTASLRGIVEEAAQEALPRVEEKSLPLQFFFGPYGRGFYIAATEKNPKPPESLKHLIQGVISVQGIAVKFTILTSEEARSAEEAALQVIKSARRF